MALVVNTNVPSIASQRFLMESRKEMETSMERLSSGLRINSAADDAAGLAISTRMDTQIRGLNVAIRNANDGISLTQTAEGAMQEVTDMLQRMRELSMQAAHAVNNDDDRLALDAEVQQLKAEIDRIAGSTEFNGQNILDGSFNRSFQIGPDSEDTLRIGIAAVNTAALGMVGESTSNDSGSINELVSARLDISSIDFAEGDILINGQELAAFDGASQDIYDLITNISNNVDNVQASAFNTVVAKTVGSGVVREDQVAIKVGAIGTSTDAWYQPERVVTLEASDSMEEMVANINKAFVDNEVVASINADGKLVLSNNTGATISIADKSGTTAAFDGATGFEVDSTIAFNAGVPATYDTVQQGFLRLTSTDDTPIEVTVGNKGLASAGTIADIQSLGFNAVDEDPSGNFYTMTGARLVAGSSLTETFGKSTATEQADLTINGVAIYDEDLTAATNTFQGKLDMINAFSDETGVVASAYYERVFDLSGATLVVGDTLDLNGTVIDVDDGTVATIDTLAANINTATATTGVSAEVNGNNLILKGDGVQNVTVAQNTYELDASTIQASARRSADTVTMEQVVAFHANDIEVGRILTLTIDPTADPDGTANAVAHFGMSATDSITYTHTVAAGESLSDVHTAFHTLMVMDIHDNAGSAVTAEQFVALGNVASGQSSDTALQIFFNAELLAGEAEITLGVTQTPAAERALYNGTTANFTDYGAIRLQSVDLTPISVELNEDHTSSLAGLVEMNVGDTTYDVNGPTFQMTGAPGTMVSGLSVTTSDGAVEAISVIDAALQMISDTRSNLGAIENRLDHTISNLANVVENTAASKSRIMDADFAAEAASLARAQVLQQAGTAMLAQANAAPQNVLSLLG